MKPRLFLDVDGVINASPNLRQPRQPDEWPHYASTRVMGLKIIYSPTLVHWLRSLEGRVEVLWLTTWNSHAQFDLAPALGLPHWPLAGDGPVEHCPRSWWKHSVVDAWSVDRTPFVWLDDDLRLDDEARGWVEQLDVDGLAIGPLDRTGLTPEHVDQVEDFLALYGAGRDRTA